MEVILVLISMLSLGMGQKCRSSIDLSVKWTVDCSEMNLSSAPPPVILHPVVTLNMSHNFMVHLTESQFSNWTDISVLDLSFNKIRTVEDNTFKGLNNLVKLDLMNNHIEILSPKITSHLPKLRTLNLSSNKLKCIETGSFVPVPYLLKLFLKNNSKLGRNLENYIALRESFSQGLAALDVENISLSEMPDDFFKDADHLISLNIALNPLHQIPALPPTLRYLNISKTLISNVTQGQFSKLELLERVSLEGMPLLKDIREHSFSNLNNLKEIFIKDCPKLSFISEDAFGESTSKLKKVVISNCALQTLPDTFKSLLSRVEYLDLQGNPWICDGRVSWIIYSAELPANLTRDLRCDKPPIAQGMLMTDYFKPKSLHPHSSLIGAGVILAMVAILMAGVVGMVRHMRKPKVKTYRQLNDIRLQDRAPHSLPPL